MIRTFDKISHKNLKKFEKFEKLMKKFKNCEVGRNDIGEFMKSFASEQDLSKKPRRMLISSMII